VVQTVKSLTIPSGQKKIFFEKPHVLCRIFFRISALLLTTQGYKSRISFGDPTFADYYELIWSNTYFEARGEGIFQGDVWVHNQSSVSITYTATEILV